jgi:hypothetical protein
VKFQLPAMGDPDPLDGERVRITVTVDGQPVIDTSLTRLWFSVKYTADPHFLPIYFRPIGTADDGTPEPDAHAPVHGALGLVALPDVSDRAREDFIAEGRQLDAEAADFEPERQGGLYVGKCDECTTGVSCEDAGRCLFEG